MVQSPQMHPVIVHGSTIESREKAVLEKFPSPTHYIIKVTSDKSISIKQVHEIREQISTVPVNNRIVWIEEAQKLTLPAQNALLKMLEEPPTKTSFALSLRNQNDLLPTIRSRCISVRVGEEEKNATLLPNLLDELKTMLSASHGERIIIAETYIKKREETLAWIENIIASLRLSLADHSVRENTGKRKVLRLIISNASATHRQLSQNVNVRLAVQNFILSLPRLK